MLDKTVSGCPIARFAAARTGFWEDWRSRG
jgi:hypothetical protein